MNKLVRVRCAKVLEPQKRDAHGCIKVGKDSNPVLVEKVGLASQDRTTQKRSDSQPSTTAKPKDDTCPPSKEKYDASELFWNPTTASLAWLTTQPPSVAEAINRKYIAAGGVERHVFLKFINATVGVGLFAAIDIPACVVITTFTGAYTSTEPEVEPGERFYHIDNRPMGYFGPNCPMSDPRVGSAYFANDAGTEAAANAKVSKAGPSPSLVSMHEIQAGQQIAWRYGGGLDGKNQPIDTNAKVGVPDDIIEARRIALVAGRYLFT